MSNKRSQTYVSIAGGAEQIPQFWCGNFATFQQRVSCGSHWPW